MASVASLKVNLQREGNLKTSQTSKVCLICPAQNKQLTTMGLYFKREIINILSNVINVVNILVFVSLNNERNFNNDY